MIAPLVVREPSAVLFVGQLVIDASASVGVGQSLLRCLVAVSPSKPITEEQTCSSRLRLFLHLPHVADAACPCVALSSALTRYPFVTFAQLPCNETPSRLLGRERGVADIWIVAL